MLAFQDSHYLRRSRRGNTQKGAFEITSVPPLTRHPRGWMAGRSANGVHLETLADDALGWTDGVGTGQRGLELRFAWLPFITANA
jgi:hypothetical protein